MSAIFGVVEFGEPPLRREDVEAITHRARVWGPDGVTCAHTPHAALGHALLVGVPEDRHSAMPLIDADRNITIVASARLDNREDLCDALGVRGADCGKTADSTLVAKAYLAWGDDCPRRLFGDWALAAWQAPQRRLFLARDHLGQTSLTYCRHGSRLVFGSDIETIFCVTGVERRIDEEQLARYLIVQPGETSRTFFSGVRRLPGAHALVSDSQSSRPHCYWHADDVPPIRHKTDADYTEEFLARYRRAVTVRLRSTRSIATTLSSGLDSGSVTALAAETLGLRGETLLALTSVPRFPSPYPGRTTDEGPLAAATAGRWANIHHLRLDAATRSPVAALDDVLAQFSEPVQGAGNMYWLLDVLDAARTANAGVLLIAQQGNTTVSWNGGIRWQARLLACLTPWPVFVGRSERSTAARLRQAAATNAFSDQIGRELDRREEVHPGLLQRRLSPRAERRTLLALSSAASAPYWHALGAAHQLDVRDPTSDIRLVECCLGLPLRQFRGPQGGRQLIRRSMRGLMPEEVLHHQTRGLQGSDIAARIRASTPVLDATLARLSASAAVGCYLDIDRLGADMRSALTRDMTTPATRDGTALRSLMAGLFILRESTR